MQVVVQPAGRAHLAEISRHHLFEISSRCTEFRAMENRFAALQLFDYRNKLRIGN
jgi:hypothetical protein